MDPNKSFEDQPSLYGKVLPILTLKPTLRKTVYCPHVYWNCSQICVAAVSCQRIDTIQLELEWMLQSNSRQHERTEWMQNRPGAVFRDSTHALEAMRKGQGPRSVRMSDLSLYLVASLAAHCHCWQCRILAFWEAPCSVDLTSDSPQTFRRLQGPN